MKKYLLVILAVSLVPGCAWWNGLFGGGGASSGGKVTTSSRIPPRQQLNDARASFDEKIKAAQGRTVSQVRKEWGDLEAGLRQGDLTVYRWSQTARVTAPAGETAPTSANGQQTTSCLALFIVSADGSVVDATSEGQGVHYRLLPGWQPVSVEPTAGRTGPVQH